MLLCGCAGQAGTAKVCINTVCVNVELADTEQKKKDGLMFREHLAENAGMLFRYNKEGLYGFWMKNMELSLDIIWIDKNNRIADIKSNALPCSDACETFVSALPAKYILEVNAGFAQRHNIKIGDIARLKK